MRMAGTMLLLALVSLTATPAAGQVAGRRLDDVELAQQRGGLMTPLGLDIGFGASVRTYVDGRLALETRLAWTDHGIVTEKVGDLGPVAAGATFGTWTASLPGLGGNTQILHSLADGRIASVVVNSASNRDIRQDTSITLTLPQLPDLQRQFAADRIAASLQNALGLSLQGSTGPGH